MPVRIADAPTGFADLFPGSGHRRLSTKVKGRGGRPTPDDGLWTARSRRWRELKPCPQRVHDFGLDNLLLASRKLPAAKANFGSNSGPHVVNRQRVAFCKTASSSRPKATLGCTAKMGSRSARMSSCIADMS